MSDMPNKENPADLDALEDALPRPKRRLPRINHELKAKIDMASDFPM